MDNMRLTKEQEELVLNNQGLIHHLLKKLVIESSDYEDMISVGMFGLIKAANTFDKSKRIHFATYASRCINNEFYMHLRREKKHKNDVFLEDILNVDQDGSELKFSDILPSSENIEKDFSERETCERLISIILNALKPKDRLLMLYKIAGFDQESIAEILKLSQSYISRLEKSLNERLESYLTKTPNYKEVFSMAIVNDTYQITFSSDDIKDFNKVFASLLQNLTCVDGIPNFRVNRNKDRVVIQLPAHPECFSFIAQIIQEIDEFDMSFTSSINTEIKK